MSSRLEMLQVARLAPRSLGADATARVADFVAEQFGTDGGVRDRAGGSDLYYTVFGLDGLIALQREVPESVVAGYLRGYGAGADLDLVHAACLARCWAALPNRRPAGDVVAGLAARIAAHRSADGGFGPQPGAARGGVYEAFLASGALEDLGLGPGGPAGLDLVGSRSGSTPGPVSSDLLAAQVLAAELPGGAWANHPAATVGTTTVTAAAVVLLRALGHRAPPASAAWLLDRLHPQGGFLATPVAPIPDLLSTATALHALVCLGVDLDPVREACLDFVDTLWTGRAFCGSWHDGVVDVEYTFYALLALGHLSA